MRCAELGIPTVKALGFGIRGRAPASRESFIITEELAGFMHLDELPTQLAALPNSQRARIQRALILDVARIARTLHSNGLNHRDFYLNHFMLPARTDGEWLRWNGENLRVHVIDLHRMQIRPATPRQWVTKDISGLLFSAFDAHLTLRDWLRFLTEYWQRPWREGWHATRMWRWHVMRRAVSLYRSDAEDRRHVRAILPVPHEADQVVAPFAPQQHAGSMNAQAVKVDQPEFAMRIDNEVRGFHVAMPGPQLPQGLPYARTAWPALGDRWTCPCSIPPLPGANAPEHTRRADTIADAAVRAGVPRCTPAALASAGRP